MWRHDWSCLPRGTFRKTRQLWETPHEKRNVHFQAQNKDNGDTIDIGNEITDPQHFHIEANYNFQREHTEENFHEFNHELYDLQSENTDENFHEPQSVPCDLPSENTDENFYEFNNVHCDLQGENAKGNFHELSNESGHVRCQINEILHEEEISDNDNEVDNSYLNQNATETLLGENTVHFGPTLAYDKNYAITEVLQGDSLRFGEKLSSGQFLKADSEETNVTPHKGNFQITRKDDNDFQLTQFATSAHQGNGENSADVSNLDQIRQESVTPPISTQLGDQFPGDFPPTERSLGSADILVSCTSTWAESHIAGENNEQPSMQWIPR